MKHGENFSHLVRKTGTLLAFSRIKLNTFRICNKKVRDFLHELEKIETNFAFVGKKCSCSTCSC